MSRTIISTLPAVLALAEKFQPVPENGHPCRAGHASGEVLQPARLEVEDAPAGHADGVVVVVRLASEVPMLSVLPMDLLDEPVADEKIQCAINGRQADADPPSPGRLIHLAGGEPLGRGLDDPEDGLARPGQAVTPLGERREHLADEGGPHSN